MSKTVAKTMKGIAVTAIAGSALASFGLATADATRVVKIPSHISIKSTGLVFSGKVTSPNSACKGGRKVVLFRTNGNRLGSTTTSSTGRWKIKVSGSAGITLGHFYAKLRRRSEGTAGTIYVCKAATSATIPFHQA